MGMGLGVVVCNWSCYTCCWCVVPSGPCKVCGACQCAALFSDPNSLQIQSSISLFQPTYRPGQCLATLPLHWLCLPRTFSLLSTGNAKHCMDASVMESVQLVLVDACAEVSNTQPHYINTDSTCLGLVHRIFGLEKS